jgi:hypothetical protein
MKTAQSIEEQEERKSARDNGSSGETSRANTLPARKKSDRGDASRIAPWFWKPGQSGNPSGRPKHDIAAEIAKAVFENNREALYLAYTKAALKGNAYAFKELADRAFGKLKERHEVEVSQYRELTDEQLLERVHQLEAELGIQRAVPEILPPADPKPN